MNHVELKSFFRVAVVLAIVAALAAVLPSAVVAGSSAPAFDPNNFSGHPIDNEWFPLTPGTTLVYKGQKDGKSGSDIFHVTHRTRMVAGVQATVVEDTLVLKGRVEEHTFDWYAQDDQGTSGTWANAPPSTTEKAMSYPPKAAGRPASTEPSRASSCRHIRTLAIHSARSSYPAKQRITSGS